MFWKEKKNVLLCLQDLKLQGHFLKRFLKKLIIEIESDGGMVLDELYEYYASCLVPLKVICSVSYKVLFSELMVISWINFLSVLGWWCQCRELEIIENDLFYFSKR